MKTLPVLAAALAALTLAACATATAPQTARPLSTENVYSEEVDTFSDAEMAEAVADFFGVTSEAAATTVERIFADQGEPVGYIAGQEGSGAFGVGLRYGQGYLTMKSGGSYPLYWQGPTLGFDVGGDASRVFMLVYNLPSPDYIFRRYPGVEGSGYFIGGMGVQYLSADGVTIAPITSGAGLRLGANVGYLVISPEQRINPF